MIAIGIILMFAGMCRCASIPKSEAGSLFVPVRGHDTAGEGVNRFHLQAGDGQYHFGFSHAGQVRSERKDAAGNIAGYYSYYRHTGQPTVVFYNADNSGFKVTSNDLPVAISPADSDLPLPVQDTPAVAKAREEFLVAFAKAELRDPPTS